MSVVDVTTSGRRSRVRHTMTRPMRRALADNRALVALVALTVVVSVLVSLFPDRFALNSMVIGFVLAPLFLAPRQLSWFTVFSMVMLALTIAQQPTFSPRVWAAVAVLYFVAVFTLVISLRRVRLGVGGAEGEAMFVDLRDRIQAQSRPPVMPTGWRLDSEVRAAGGTPFSGDFFCFSECVAHGRFDAVLVDVSGKGVKAGVRSLQLSGALNGLFGAVPSEQLLADVNSYLLRQDWAEDFATAVLVSVDLRTGAYEVRSAGHPPALVRTADGTVQRLDGGGPLLGLLDGAEFPPISGVLAAGDAIVLYTDGVVERSGLDIDEGIARLAQQIGADLAPDGAAALVLGATGNQSDDRAVLVLQRD